MGKIKTMSGPIRFRPRNRDEAVAVLTLASIARVAMTSDEVLAAITALETNPRQIRNLLTELKRVGAAYEATGDLRP